MRRFRGSFAVRRFDLGFARLDVPLREGPVSAVDMLDEQNFSVAVKLAVDNGTAGFFMQHFFAFLADMRPLK